MKIEFVLKRTSRIGQTIHALDGNTRLRNCATYPAIVLEGGVFDYKRTHFPERLYKIIWEKKYG